MTHTTRPRFGIMTAPMNVDYQDILRVWREADMIPEIEHAWLFDHLMPIGGDPNGPIFEGWTVLSALAATTRRLRVGLLVTSNRFRPPAVLAKIATTVDIVSGGRLDFGIIWFSFYLLPVAMILAAVLGGVDPFGEHQRGQRAPRSDPPRQMKCDAGVGHQAQAREGRQKIGVVARDDDVAGQRETHAGAHCRGRAAR